MKAGIKLKAWHFLFHDQAFKIPLYLCLPDGVVNISAGKDMKVKNYSCALFSSLCPRDATGCLTPPPTV